MPIYRTNPLDSAFRHMWIAFTGLFVSVIGFGFVVHDVSRPVLDRLSQTGNRSPEMVRGLQAEALMAPLPIITGLMALTFLTIFICSGALFLLRSIKLLAQNDEEH
jgi:hypothetical protein